MNWKLFTGTFVLIFLAELGDKTQLAAMARAAGSGGAKWTVFVAASLALVAATLLAVLLGGVLTRLVPERTIKVVAGVLFVVFGFLILRSALAPASLRAAAPVLPRGPLAQVVLKAAAQFERGAIDDYEALAAGADDPRRRALFRRLADEERQHLARLESERPAPDLRLADIGRPLPVPAVLEHDAASAPDPVLQHAIEHEEATAGFYRELARLTPSQGLRGVFEFLAAEEADHAARLKTQLEDAPV